MNYIPKNVYIRFESIEGTQDITIPEMKNKGFCKDITFLTKFVMNQHARLAIQSRVTITQD